MYCTVLFFIIYLSQKVHFCTTTLLELRCQTKGWLSGRERWEMGAGRWEEGFEACPE